MRIFLSLSCMKMFDIKLIWSLLFLCSIFKSISCSGIVEIRLLKYINSGGVGSNGHCCDGRGPFCFSDCDHQFKICIDNADGPDNINSCPYYRRDSGELVNSNTVTFGTSIAGLKNPIKIPFDSWPGELKLKVDVWDVDDNSHDHVDFLSGVFGLKASRSATTAAVTAFQIRKRTLLTYNVKVYCDEFYYGEYCDTFCKAADDEFGHYTCDTTTGSFICDEGWSGPFCDGNDINECLYSPCNGTKTCIDTPNGFYCQCPDGLEGSNCDESVNATCRNDTCHNNGTCELVQGHVVCDCPQGFIGLTCEMKFDLCDHILCYNNGTCVTKLSNFECECHSGFSGEYCENTENVTSTIMPSTSIGVKPQTINTTETVTNATGGTNITVVMESQSDKTNEVTSTTTSVVTTVATETTTKSHTTLATETTPKSHTTLATETTTKKKVTKTKLRPTLFVRGRVDKNNKESVGKGLRDLLYELIAIKDQLYLTLKYQVETTDEGDIVSKIIIDSAKDGEHTINGTIIQHLFDHSPTSVIEQHIHLPVIRERPMVAHTHGDTDHHHNSFMHDYWYLVVILVLIVVFIIIAVGVFILYKHKKLAEPQNKEEVPRQNPGISEPSSSSQSFENSLYFEMKKNNNKKQPHIEFAPMP